MGQSQEAEAETSFQMPESRFHEDKAKADSGFLPMSDHDKRLIELFQSRV